MGGAEGRRPSGEAAGWQLFLTARAERDIESLPVDVQEAARSLIGDWWEGARGVHAYRLHGKLQSEVKLKRGRIRVRLELDKPKRKAYIVHVALRKDAYRDG